MVKYVYKAKCPYCDKDMNYIEDKEMEKRGWISFDCSDENCLGHEGFLVPEDSKYITKEEEVKISKKDKIKQI